VVEKAEDKKKAVNKKEAQKLVQKYSKNEDFGNSLGDLLKQALKNQE
jgi:DNA topoisomerase III